MRNRLREGEWNECGTNEGECGNVNRIAHDRLGKRRRSPRSQMTKSDRDWKQDEHKEYLGCSKELANSKTTDIDPAKFQDVFLVPAKFQDVCLVPAKFQDVCFSSSQILGRLL